MTKKLDANTRFILLPPSKSLDKNWHITDDADCMVANFFGFDYSTDEDSKLFAERVLHCLNAFQGISNPEVFNIKKLLEEKQKVLDAVEFIKVEMAKTATAVADLEAFKANIEKIIYPDKPGH